MRVNRDVARVRAGEDTDDTIALDDGLALLHGVRDLVLAAACFPWNSHLLYRAALRGLRLLRVFLGQQIRDREFLKIYQALNVTY